MKREFLQKFQVGGVNLPKDVIDAILDVHAQEVSAVKERLSAAQDALKAFEGVDVAALQQEVEGLRQRLADASFQSLLDGAITAAKGRNAKAITALLDLDALRDGGDIAAALETLKGECGYLFDDAPVPPPYSAVTGTQTGAADTPRSLAAALRERYGAS